MDKVRALAMLAALGTLNEIGSEERGSRGYRSRSAAHWDEKRQAKAEKKRQRQNKKKNRK